MSMITLIHGEDTAASRNYYWQIKQKVADGVTLDGVSISPTDLQQAVGGEDLFGTKKTLFIESLISKRKSSKEIEQFADTINSSDADIVLWESKELTPKQVGLLKNATVKIFKIPATIFALLDNVKPGNGKVVVQHFHQTLEEKDPEFVLVMLQRQVRILLAFTVGFSLSVASKQSLRHSERSEESESHNIDPSATPQDDKTRSSSGSTISEVSRLAPWQKGKLEKQAKLFTQEQLLHLHNQLFQLELAMKTGGLTLPLAQSLDFALLSL